MPATNYIMVEDRRTLRHSAFSGIVPGPPDHPSLVAFSHIYPSSHRREVLSLLFTFWPLVILCPVHTENTQATAQPKNPHFQPQSETQKKGGESQSLKAFKDQTQMRKWSAPPPPHSSNRWLGEAARSWASIIKGAHPRVPHCLLCFEGRQLPLIGNSFIHMPDVHASLSIIFRNIIKDH